MATALQQRERSGFLSWKATTLGLSVEQDHASLPEGENILFLYEVPAAIDKGYFLLPDALHSSAPNVISALTANSNCPGTLEYMVTAEFIGKGGTIATVENVAGSGKVVTFASHGMFGVSGGAVTSGYLGMAGNIAVPRNIANAVAYGHIRGGVTTDATDDRVTVVVDRILSSVGSAKRDAQKSAATIFARTGGSVGVLDQIVRSLVNSRRSGAIDDAIDVLALVTRGAVRLLVRDASHRLSEESGNESYENYWYAVIRAAGRLGDRETVEQFIDSRSFAIQEAVVEALSEVGDSKALEDLKRIANDSARPESIRGLALELASDIA